MDKVPYQTLMYMNAIIPEYKKGSAGAGASSATKKRMTLFEMAEAAGKGEKI